MRKLADMLRDWLSSDANAEERAALESTVAYMEAIDAALYKVGDAREKLPDLRELAQKGAAAVIADRGRIAGLSNTTLMVSAETLTALIQHVIVSERTKLADREPASALLANLTPVSPHVSDVTVGTLPGDRPSAGVEDLAI